MPGMFRDAQVQVQDQGLCLPFWTACDPALGSDANAAGGTVTQAPKEYIITEDDIKDIFAGFCCVVGTLSFFTLGVASRDFSSGR
jgi:hypothetical protein